MGRVFIDPVDTSMDSLFKTFRVIGAGHIMFLFFLNGFGSKVIRSKPAPLTSLSFTMGPLV